MGNYVVRRVLQAVPVLWGATLATFLLVQIIPGDAAQVILGGQATPDAVAAVREQLGLNDPIHIQYGRWLGNILQGDFGTSYQTRAPVREVLLAKFQNTLLLTMAALVFAAAVGVTAGVLSATRQHSLFDRVAMFVALFGNSMPVFWLGLVLIVIFSLQLGWLPSGGMQSVRGDGGPLDVLKHMVLPTIALSSVTMALIARMVRSSLLEVIRQEYVLTARAKGLSNATVVWRHALRNALLPVVTVVGLQFGYLLGGAVLTETVFVWPGVGLAIYNAITGRDIPLIQGAILLTSFTFVVINLLVDISYAYLDPRIRYA
jgi:peptide/nickel transport system permease protein